MMTTAITTLRQHGLLQRLVEEPELVSLIRALEPRALGKLIEHVGLEDSGEIVSLATTPQLEHLLDEDLWRNEQPGRDESFDADRFALWLEVMLEAGEGFVAESLSELPEELLTLGLHRQLLVLRVDELFSELADRGDEAELIEKALDGYLYLELGDYQLVSRTNEGWDAIVSALLALDKHHHDQLERILERCWRASSEQIEESGGLYRALTSDEMLELDAAAGREERRARAGFVAPASAAAFLEHARATPLDELVASRTRDPITRAYFRELGEPVIQEPAKLIRILEESGVIEVGRPRVLLESGSNVPFRRGMRELFEREPLLYARRMDELAYLANTLVAGGSKEGGRYRASEAVEAVLSICNRGLEHLLDAGEPPVDVLSSETADKLFRIGWHLAERSGGPQSPPL